MFFLYYSHPFYILSLEIDLRKNSHLQLLQVDLNLNNEEMEKSQNDVITAVVKKVVGTHYFLAIFGPIGAHFSPQPLWQPHGMAVSHIVKVNHTVIERGIEYD